MSDYTLPFIAHSSKIPASWGNDITSRVVALESKLANAILDIDAARTPGMLLVDSFAGTDDQKLASARGAAAKSSTRPGLLFPFRDFRLNTTKGLKPYDGERWFGCFPGPKNPEISSALGPRVILGSQIGTGATALFSSTGTCHDVGFWNITFQGTGTQQFWDQPSNSVYPAEFSALTFYGMKHIFGRSGQKALMTQVVTSGHWTVIGATDTPFNVGGSDMNLWTAGYLNMGSGFAGSGKYQMILDAVSKTPLGPIYVTCVNGWLGVRVRGSDSTDGSLTFSSGSRFEGGNSNNPCDGSVLRLDGGCGAVRDAWIAYGMANPSRNGGTSKGLIHITAGNWILDGLTYKRATGVSESVPLVYVSGGNVVVRNATGRGFSGKPVVQVVGGSVSTDTSVTRV